MDTKFQTSFIPKKSVIPSGRAERLPRPVDFFSVIANVVLVITVLASVGVFGYQWYLSNSIETLDMQLAEMEDIFEPNLIAELSRLDSSLKFANDIFAKHISLTAIFEFLESTTFQNVYFTSFDYAYGENDITIELDGKATNYSTLVLQSDEFVNSKYVRNAAFSNLDLDSTGNVIFRLTLKLDSASFLYKSNIQTLSFDGFPF